MFTLILNEYIRFIMIYFLYLSEVIRIDKIFYKFSKPYDSLICNYFFFWNGVSTRSS
jgi:hypothetical protein